MNYQNVKLTGAQALMVLGFMGGYVGRARATTSAYETDVSQFIHWLENEKGQSVRGLTFSQATKRLAEFSRALGSLAETTRVRKVKVARYFLASVGHDVPAPPARPAEPVPPVWVSPEQADRLLASAGLTARQRFLIALLSLEGMRPGYIVGLTYSPEHSAGGLILEDPGTYAYILDYLKDRGKAPGPLFHAEDTRGNYVQGRPLSRQWVWKESRRIGETLNIRECTPAALRITNVLRLDRKGLSPELIAQRLGLHRSSVYRILRRSN